MSTKTNTLRYDFEPWYCGELLRENGTSICAFAEEPSKENAARLVSSWNVCRDSTVEELAAIEQSGATLASIANERDELLVALRSVMEIDCPLTGNPSIQALIEHWEYEKSVGREEADDRISALRILAKHQPGADKVATNSWSHSS